MNNALWYIGRGTGVTTLVLLTVVLSLGILVRTGRALPGLPRFAVSGIHRSLSLTALGFLLVHITTLLLDPIAQLRLTDVVLPFLATYRPMWQGLGTVAFDLVVLLIASSLLRHRIGLTAWRLVHWAAYLCWPFALLHSVGIGTDRGSHWLLAVVGGCVGVAAAAVGYRLYGRYDDEDAPIGVTPPRGLAGLR